MASFGPFDDSGLDFEEKRWAKELVLGDLCSMFGGMQSRTRLKDDLTHGGLDMFGELGFFRWRDPPVAAARVKAARRLLLAMVFDTDANRRRRLQLYLYPRRHDKQTLLHMAAGAGDAQCVALALKAGASASRLDAFGNAPTHMAANKECLALLLEAGGPADTPNLIAHTHLLCACRRGDAGSVQLLIKVGADINWVVEGPNADLSLGRTALMVATKARSAACIELLAAAGATLQPCTADDNPLMVAVCNEDVDCISALIGAGACSCFAMTGPDGNTPLEEALSRRNATLTKLLAAAMPTLTVSARVCAPGVGPHFSISITGDQFFMDYGALRAAALARHEADRLACIAALQDESCWRRRRALALVREQRQAARDAATAARDTDDSGNTVEGGERRPVAAAYSAMTLQAGDGNPEQAHDRVVQPPTAAELEAEEAEEGYGVDGLLACDLSGGEERQHVSHLHTLAILYPGVSVPTSTPATLQEDLLGGELIGLTGRSMAWHEPAAARSRMEAARTVLQSHLDSGEVNKLRPYLYPRRRDERTLLHMAAEAGDAQCVALVLKAHARAVYSVDTWGESPCHVAWNAACVAHLLRAGCHVDTASSCGDTQLHRACTRGDAGSVQLLIQAGANVNRLVDRIPNLDDESNEERAGAFYSPLQLAARAGSAACIELLVAAGAELQPRTHATLPLAMAAGEGHLDCVTTLLRLGAVVDGDGEGFDNPLHRAGGRNEGCALALLAAGANVNVARYGGTSALDYAVKFRSARLVQLLAAGVSRLAVEAGACSAAASAHDSYWHRHLTLEQFQEASADCSTALQQESCWRRRRPLALVREQRQAARDAALARRVLQQDDGSGVGAGVGGGGVGTSGVYTAVTLSGGGIKQRQGAGVKERPAEDNLLAAVSTGDAGRLWRLINAGADVNAVVRTKTGDTALHVAVEGGHRECAAALVEAGANVGAANTLGITPLLAACANGTVGCAELLLERCTRHGRSMQSVAGDALVIAAWRGQKACVALLAKARHIGLVHSVFGRHALLAAVATGHIGCVSTLARHGANLEARLTEGRTALQVAVESGNAECVGALIAAGADVDPAKSRRESRSHGGLWDDDEDDDDDDYEDEEDEDEEMAPDDDDGTENDPAYRALERGYPAVVALLLRAGAAMPPVAATEELLAALDDNSYRRWDETMREVLQCEARWRRRRGLLLLREQRIAARDAVEAGKRSGGKRRKEQ